MAARQPAPVRSVVDPFSEYRQLSLHHLQRYPVSLSRAAPLRRVARRTGASRHHSSPALACNNPPGRVQLGRGRGLAQRNTLDRPLVLAATGFGRPPEFDERGVGSISPPVSPPSCLGRVARGGQAIGVAAEIGKEILERPVSIPDFAATIHPALGIDVDKDPMNSDNRPIPIADFGQPLEDLFS